MNKARSLGPVMLPLLQAGEQLVGDRLRVVRGIAAKLAVELPGDWQPRSPHGKQADEFSRVWTDALRASTDR